MQTHHSIRDEGMPNERKFERSFTPSIEHPVHVLSHVGENLMYVPKISTLTQYEIPLEMAAPLDPKPKGKTKVQQITRCTKLVIPVLITKGFILFWVCKNLNWH